MIKKMRVNEMNEKQHQKFLFFFWIKWLIMIFPNDRSRRRKERGMRKRETRDEDAEENHQHHSERPDLSEVQSVNRNDGWCLSHEVASVSPLKNVTLFFMSPRVIHYRDWRRWKEKEEKNLYNSPPHTEKKEVLFEVKVIYQFRSSSLTRDERVKEEEAEDDDGIRKSQEPKEFTRWRRLGFPWNRSPLLMILISFLFNPSLNSIQFALWSSWWSSCNTLPPTKPSIGSRSKLETGGTNSTWGVSPPLLLFFSLQVPSPSDIIIQHYQNHQ